MVGDVAVEDQKQKDTTKVYVKSTKFTPAIVGKIRVIDPKESNKPLQNNQPKKGSSTPIKPTSIKNKTPKKN